MEDINNIEQEENTNNEDPTKIKELENNWKRALADYQNLQKRYFEEKDQIAAYANSQLLSRFLPVVDNLEMLQTHLKDQGLDMVVREFKNILSEEGLEQVKTEQQIFDAHTMEAVETEATEDSEMDGKVIKTVINGYFLKGKLIRPARVVVAKYNN